MKKGKKCSLYSAKANIWRLWCGSSKFFLFVQLWPENLCWLWWGRIWRSSIPGPGCRKIWIPNEMEELDSFPRRSSLPQILRHLCAARGERLCRIFYFTTSARSFECTHLDTTISGFGGWVCVRLLHLNAELRISLLSGRLVTWVMMVPAVGPDTVAYLYEKARGKKLSFIKFQRIARAEFSSSKKPPRVE